MKNFKLWGVVTLVTAFLMMFAHLYENVTLYIVLGAVLLVSLVLTINSIEL